MMQQGKRKRVVGALAVMVIAGVLTWRYLPRERLLLPRSTHVLSVSSPYDPLAVAPARARKAYAGQPALLVYDPYYWKSNQEVILFRLTAGPPPQYQAYCQHLDTGRQEPLPALNRLLAAEILSNQMIQPAASRYILAIWVQEMLNLSPNGQWMLCNFQQTTANSYQFDHVVLALDGSRRIVWHDAPDYIPSLLRPMAWLPDSRHWISLHSNTESEASLLIHDIGSPHTALTRKIVGASGLLSFPQQRFVRLLGITRAGEALLGEYTFGGPFGKQFTPQKLLSIPLALDGQSRDNATVQAHRTTVRAPQNGGFLVGIPFLEPHPVLSPQGDRLAWVILREYDPPGPTWLRRLEGYIGLRRRTLVGLWVSRVDGSQMQEIGHIDYKAGEEVPQEIRWTPDGKRLSFLYKGALYTVPVD